MVDARVLDALLLTGLGALGTLVGGLLVVVQPKFDFKKLGYLQGLAAGLMLSISFFDLFPESVQAIGFAQASSWFFIGVIFFALVVAFIPEPDASGLVLDEAQPAIPAAAKPLPEATIVKSSAETPSTAVRRSSRLRSGKAQAAAGATSDAEAEKPAAEASSAAAPAQTASTQQDDGSAAAAAREARKKVLMSGLITALGLALHNFPEGVAVFLGSMKSHAIGASLALAIALHNIPEGVAVALPVYFATGSRLKGLTYAVVSGLAEPAAVVVLGLVMHDNLNHAIIDCLLAAVGGIMAFLSFHELLPLAMEHAGRRQAVLAMFAGMAIMNANLYLVDQVMGGEGHH